MLSDTEKLFNEFVNQLQLREKKIIMLNICIICICNCYDKQRLICIAHDDEMSI